MENIIPRIEKLMQQPNLNKFEQEFLPSIKSQYEKKNALSDGQLNTLAAMEDKYSPEKLEQQKAWRESWDNKKKLAFKHVVDFYSRTGYYFVNTLRRVRENPDYIPDEKEYTNIVENKYAQKYLKNLEIPAKFNIGDLVQVRSGRGWDSGLLCIILADNGITSSIKGGREYIVSHISDNSNSRFMEADLKIAREKTVDKISK